MSRRRMVVIYL